MMEKLKPLSVSTWNPRLGLQAAHTTTHCIEHYKPAGTSSWERSSITLNWINLHGTTRSEVESMSLCDHFINF